MPTNGCGKYRGKNAKNKDHNKMLALNVFNKINRNGIMNKI